MTPIALPVDAAISYYESLGSALGAGRLHPRPARPPAIAALGRYFLEAIHPFVWRRSLDFGAIGEIQSITRRIRDHYAQGQAFGPGFDLKRGRGGIREIEFFAQIHQLIHGGREPELRAPATLDALAALAEAGRIGADEAAALARRPTACCAPSSTGCRWSTTARPTACPPIPRRSTMSRGCTASSGGAALLALLEPHVERVAAIYDTLDGGEGRRLPNDPEALEASLAEAGFADAGAGAGADRGLALGQGSARCGPRPRARPSRRCCRRWSRRSAAAPDPMRAMNRFEDLIERLPSGVNFYRLLEARPA